MLGSSDDWQILGNHFGGGSGVTLTGTGSVMANNFGYNPVGRVVNPWPSSSADLTNNVASGSPDPQSATVYTVRDTPKTVVVSGGNVSQILIDGADSGSTAGAFKPGDE